MTDVYIVTLAIIGYLISAPGLAAALTLFLPRVTETAALRIQQTPGRAFVAGLPVTLVMGLMAGVLNGIGGPAQALAFIIALVWLGALALGTAGMARLLGERLAGMVGGSEMGNILRGAVIYELAALTPVVGWFLFTPLMSQVAVGAALFGLLRWAPRPKPAAGPSQPSGAGAALT